MEHFDLAHALLGGAISALGAVGLLSTHGRIAGISGLFGSAMTRGPVDGRASRLGFLVGVFAAGLGAAALQPQALYDSTRTAPAALVLAGVLVGVGSAVGNGCTSGHGLCGLGRMSPRSMVAVALFCGVGALSLQLTRLLAGGAL